MVLGDGWRDGRLGEGRDGARDGCRGRMKGEKINSVLISGLRRGYIVLGAFYLDVAAAGVRLALLFHALSLSLPSSFSLCKCVCVYNQDKCVYFLVYVPFVSPELPPAASPAFQERCNFFLIIQLLLVLPPLYLCLRSPNSSFLLLFLHRSCSCVQNVCMCVFLLQMNPRLL